MWVRTATSLSNRTFLLHYNLMGSPSYMWYYWLSCHYACMTVSMRNAWSCDWQIYIFLINHNITGRWSNNHKNKGELQTDKCYKEQQDYKPINVMKCSESIYHSREIWPHLNMWGPVSLKKQHGSQTVCQSAWSTAANLQEHPRFKFLMRTICDVC